MNPINPKATNARFWDVINNSPVKITLRPGQELDWYSYQQTDEGFYAEALVWRHTREEVVVVAHIKAQDCDGRFDRSATMVCEIGQLRSGAEDETGACDHNGHSIFYPAWGEKSSDQRDFSAEAMGY